ADHQNARKDRGKELADIRKHTKDRSADTNRKIHDRDCAHTKPIIRLDGFPAAAQAIFNRKVHRSGEHFRGKSVRIKRARLSRHRRGGGATLEKGGKSRGGGYRPSLVRFRLLGAW